MNSSYLDDTIDLIEPKDIDKKTFIDNEVNYRGTSIGGFANLYINSSQTKDNIFREIIDKIPAEYQYRINNFIVSLGNAYMAMKKPSMQYVPLRIADSDENGIIYDWIFENTRIFFIFNTDGKDSCSIVKYNPDNGILTNSIIPLVEDNYDELCKKIIPQIF